MLAAYSSLHDAIAPFTECQDSISETETEGVSETLTKHWERQLQTVCPKQLLEQKGQILVILKQKVCQKARAKIKFQIL